MTVVIGTAGHIDHGKTTLLRALTGIDADRLPEERRRGMTIDVGYAHLTLPDGGELDFVDVPGHDRLVGNMLVGAGEIDAAILVVAADDGPSAQTMEHLALLSALGLRYGVVVVTKIDVAGEARALAVVAEVRRLLAGTSLDGSPILAVSSTLGTGLGELRTALIELRDRALAERDRAFADAADRGGASPGSRLAIDRVFTVKGRGEVVTGTLRGGPLVTGATLRLVPGDRTVRVREVHVHGASVGSAGPGRTALNLSGGSRSSLHRGVVLTDDPAVTASDLWLIQLDTAWPDRTRARVHLGTAAVDGTLSRAGRDALDLPDGSAGAILRLAAPLAVAAGDRLVMRRLSGAERIVGAVVLDGVPARGVARRRQSPDRVWALATALTRREPAAIAAARLDLHGALPGGDGTARVAVAPDVVGAIDEALVAVARSGEVAARSGVAADRPGDAADRPGDAADRPGDAAALTTSLTWMRAFATRTLRRLTDLDRVSATVAGMAAVDRLVADGRLIREGVEVRLPGAATVYSPAADPMLLAAMERLELALAILSPPSLAAAARVAGCPPAGVRELERSGRIVVLESDLAYAMSTYRDLSGRALALAAHEPLTPAALRDATGTSRKYVMAILEDLDRRAILRRTPNGHVPGPRAPQPARSKG